METTSKSGFQYIIEKRSFENKDSFHEKCWDITKKEPTTQESFRKAYRICQLKQNELEFGCKYSVSN